MAILLAGSLVVSCVSSTDDGLGELLCEGCVFSCETAFQQDEPFKVLVQDCVFGTPDLLSELRFYDFSDEEHALKASSSLSSLDRVEIRARRSYHETDALRPDEVSSQLLQNVTEFLRSRGVTEIELLTPDKLPDPDLF